MIDIELIRNDPERVKASLLKRMDAVDLAPLIEADDARRRCIQSAQTKSAERNQVSREIGRLKRAGEDTSDLQRQTGLLRSEIDAIEKNLEATNQRLHLMLSELPNLPADDVPAGGKEANQVLKTWGEKPKPVSNPKDHVELCTNLGLVDYGRGTKLGGSGSWLYTGQGAALEWALLDFFCREHIKDGYEFMLPPHLLLEECGHTAGQFPKFRDEVYHLQLGGSERHRFLLPTSETAILNVYRDEIIPFERLPVRCFAYSPCYRREAGSHRTEERGTIRGHQFNKVEMFQFVAPEQHEGAFQELLRKSESLLEQLGLHYRTSLLAARDASASMALTYDIEVWLPSLGVYKEVSSCSWAGAYQARGRCQQV